jgi:medium-chain acyl-[acyl-carrier-protein] hydrolase
MNNEWFVIPKPNVNADLKLICFPYAGGSASTYLPWIKNLPDNVELIIIQAPGRGTRMGELAYSDMQTLIGDLVKIIPSVLNKPYILFGHSLGSRIAFELMSQLKKLSHALPQHFIASGSRGPHHKSMKEPIYDLPDDEFIEELKGLNGTPQAVLENKELMELFLPLLKADFEIANRYYYTEKACFDCPITVFGGEYDVDICLSKLSSWGTFFETDADVHLFPENHFFIDSQSKQVQQKVNDIIQNCLTKLELQRTVKNAQVPTSLSYL